MKKLIILLAILPLTASARVALRIGSDWDFAPYEFINTDGQTDGFSIDVLKTVLDPLGYPYEFVMNTRKNGIEAFQNGNVDIIVSYNGLVPTDNCYQSINALGYYSLAAAFHKDTKIVKSINELKGQEVVINSSNDSVALKSISRKLNGAIPIPHSPREALAGISDGHFKYFVFGIEPLKWKLKEYNIQNIAISPLDIPAIEIRIIAHDKALIDEIDNQFARLQQSGKIDRLNNKWFHPERIGTQASPYLKYIIFAVILLAIFAFALYRIARSRVKAAIRRYEVSEATMHKALTMGKFSVLINDLRQKRLYNQHGHELPEEGISTEEMRAHIHPDDRDKMAPAQRRKKTKKGTPTPFTMRWNLGKDANKPNYATVTGYSYPEFNEHGKPTSILIISKDITAELEREERERTLTKRYMKMFDTALIAMSFYDKEGNLVDLNQNMKKLIGLGDENLEFFKKVKFYEIEMMKGDFDPRTLDDVYFCQHMCYPQIGLDKYIEMRIRSIKDENGKLLFYLVTSRETTEERNMYLELKKQRQAINQAAETNIHYEKELRTLLENCNMYVWHADIATGNISFSRSVHGEEFKESLQEYADGMFPEFRKQALDNITRIASLRQTFNFVRHFHHTPVSDTPKWVSVSGMPIIDEHDNVTSLFGVVRDVTDLMEAQERLKEETARAENSAMLKSTFLANMTHEIRTPLNAIVGFSDVLQMVDTPDERKEIIHIIRNNCDMLMRLINDIIEASTIDVKPLSIKPHNVDFAAEFLTVCQSLSQRVQEPGVEFLVDAPFTTFKTCLDMGRIQQVITNFVTNAVKYTHKGHIRVGYRYEDCGLHIYCEDTGAGIPKEKQARVFDRFVKLNDFVQGTGLGLAICKSIAERCNGKIGLNSEGTNQGSTFWIWIPCEKLKD